MTIIIYRIVACINLLKSLTKEEKEGNSSNKQQNPQTALTFFTEPPADLQLIRNT